MDFDNVCVRPGACQLYYIGCRFLPAAAWTGEEWLAIRLRQTRLTPAVQYFRTKQEADDYLAFRIKHSMTFPAANLRKVNPPPRPANRFSRTTGEL